MKDNLKGQLSYGKSSIKALKIQYIIKELFKGINRLKIFLFYKP